MKTELTLAGLATILCIISVIEMSKEDEIVAVIAFAVVGIGCLELMYKTIKNDL